MRWIGAAVMLVAATSHAVFLVQVGGGSSAEPAEAGLYVDVDSIGGTPSDTNPGTREFPFQTIQAAVDAADPGDTVFLRAGFYYETVTITNGGTASQPLVLKGYHGERVVIDGLNQRSRGIIFPGSEPNYFAGIVSSSSGNGDYVRIENLQLANFNLGVDQGTAIEVIGRSGVVISNVVIANAGKGIVIRNCENVEIRDSEIHHCNPIYVGSPSRNVRITGNHIHHGTGTNGYAINVYSPLDASVQQANVSVVDAGSLVAECTVDINASAADLMAGRDLQAEAEPAGFYPHSLLFYTNAPAVSGYATPWPTGDVAGGQKMLANGKVGFLPVNNSAWGNKPYSSDGTKVRVQVPDAAAMTALLNATYVHFINTWNPAVQTNSDFVVTGNTIHDANCQGMRFTNIEGLFVQGNALYASGASGIYVGDGCRKVWIAGNSTFNNSAIESGGCGIQTALARDVVVQNNAIYGSSTGCEVSQSRNVLVRRNQIFNNKAQNHATLGVETDDVAEEMAIAAGMVFSSAGQGGIAAPPVIDGCALVHNTLSDNATVGSPDLYGSLMYGEPTGLPSIGGTNAILNNIVASRQNENLFSTYEQKPFRMDGNLYDGASNARMLSRTGGSASFVEYLVASSSAFDAYITATGLDSNSVVGAAAFTDSAAYDFSLQSGSAAIDIGVPLAYALSAGTGTNVPVSSTRTFSDGFRTGNGEVLAGGDTIMLGTESVQILSIDRDAGTLAIDRSVSWAADEPITYEFSGSAPDAGALEYTGP